ncbi:hypothetical protein ACFL1H_00300 [Nanoarchaeota archaeon]
MTKINENNYLERLEEVIKAGVPYKVKTFNDLEQRGNLEPFQVFNDGLVEVILGSEDDEREKITLPFISWWDKTYGRRGGGRGINISEDYITVFEKLGCDIRCHKVKYKDIFIYKKDPDKVKIELHAIYDYNNNNTHYFLWPKDY